MSTSTLPPRPSLESLRKQAKKLKREIGAGDTVAIARARAQLPQAKLPLSQRDAQLVLAREYGFPGWQDLVKEVNQRLGKGLEWAVSLARRRIHDNDVEGLRQEFWRKMGANELFEMELGRLGKLTGGRSIVPSPEENDGALEASELSKILASVRNEAVSQYTVGFVPSPLSGAPREHKLEIKLASKSSGQLIGGKRQAIY